jgi:hypothetical protein
MDNTRPRGDTPWRTSNAKSMRGRTMDIVIYSPVWFFGYDSIAELISMFITFFIGLYSHRVYKLSGQRKFKFLYLSFMLFGIAFLAKSVTNWIIYKEWVTQQLYIGKVVQLYALYNFGFLLHVLLMLSGYLLLLFLLWDVHDRRVISLAFVFIACTALLTQRVFALFHVMSFILLGYLAWEFWKNARKTRRPTAYTVFAAFLILMVSQLVFIFIDQARTLYVAGEIVQLAGYLVLLGTLLVLFKR